MGRRSDIDWDAVRRDYEANQLTDKELAARYDVNRTSIYRKAEQQGWQRNLASQVRERTQARLVRSDARVAGVGGKVESDGNATPGRTDALAPDAVEVAAAANVEVILGHREVIGRARRITDRLLTEAEAQFDDMAKVLPALAAGELTVAGKPLNAKQRASIATALARARDLPARAATLKALSEAMRVQVGLERQAFGIDKNDGGEDPRDQEDFRTRLTNARTRALDSRAAP